MRSPDIRPIAILIALLIFGTFSGAHLLLGQDARLPLTFEYGYGEGSGPSLNALLDPPAKPLAQLIPADDRVFFYRLSIAPSLYIDREGRIYIDINPTFSLGLKPAMGSLELWTKSRDFADILQNLSLTVYIRYDWGVPVVPRTPAE